MFSDYENPLLRGIEEPRAWNIQDEIGKYCSAQTQALDIGCGTLHKWLALKDKVKSLTGLEYNANMLANARTNISSWNSKHIRLVHGDAHHLPFPDNTFHLVTAIMAPSVQEDEVFRVLKPGGIFLLEVSTELSQRNLKKAFGKDERGWRGMNCELPEGTIIAQRKSQCERIFGNCTVRHQRWRNWLSRESLVCLLEQVPIVRNFGKPGDREIVDNMMACAVSEKGYLNWQDRLLLVAHKAA